MGGFTPVCALAEPKVNQTQAGRCIFSRHCEANFWVDYYSSGLCGLDNIPIGTHQALRNIRSSAKRWDDLPIFTI